MKKIACTNCGANDLVKKDGYFVCECCESKFIIEVSDVPRKSMGSSLQEDIDNLLEKCRNDPRNAWRYANLVLDMDPDNSEARMYLYG